MSALDTTRRAVLAATAPIAAELALAPFVRPALALAANPDAGLFVLRGRWLETLAAFNAALEAKDAAGRARHAALRELGWPEWPSVGDADYGLPAIELVAKARTNAMDVVEADVIARVAAADAAEEATSEANKVVVEKIAAMPARTLAGVAFKVTVSEEWLHGNEEMIDSIMADVAAFAAAYPTLSI